MWQAMRSPPLAQPSPQPDTARTRLVGKTQQGAIRLISTPPAGPLRPAGGVLVFPSPIVPMPSAKRLRSAPGTYALLLRASASCSVAVGAAGTMDVQPGAYVYVGSALGPGGVRARVERHARTEKTAHWHVDYVRAVTTLDGAWVAYRSRRLECAWAAAIRSMPSVSIPLHGVGASDCGCPAHLLRFPTDPDREAVARRLEASVPDAPVVCTLGGDALRADGS
mgnify:FL=1